MSGCLCVRDGAGQCTVIFNPTWKIIVEILQQAHRIHVTAAVRTVKLSANRSKVILFFQYLFQQKQILYRHAFHPIIPSILSLKSLILWL